MPIFNIATESPPSNQGGFFDITDPEFLATLNGSEWVSAETALKNSDLFSIISQLSNDLATAKLTTSRKQMQGIVDNPSNNANRFNFYQPTVATPFFLPSALVDWTDKPSAMCPYFKSFLFE